MDLGYSRSHFSGIFFQHMIRHIEQLCQEIDYHHHYQTSLGHWIIGNEINTIFFSFKYIFISLSIKYIHLCQYYFCQVMYNPILGCASFQDLYQPAQLQILARIVKFLDVTRIAYFI